MIPGKAAHFHLHLVSSTFDAECVQFSLKKNSFMKGNQQLLFFYLKSHAWFVPFIFCVVPFRFFPPIFYGLHKRVRAKFSTTASSHKTSNIYGVKAWPAQEHTKHPKLKEAPLHMELERAMISLGSQRHEGIVCMARTQQWRNKHTSGRTEGKKSCPVWRSGLKTHKSHQ